MLPRRRVDHLLQDSLQTLCRECILEEQRILTLHNAWILSTDAKRLLVTTSKGDRATNSFAPSPSRTYTKCTRIYRSTSVGAPSAKGCESQLRPLVERQFCHLFPASPHEGRTSHHRRHCARGGHQRVASAIACHPAPPTGVPCSHKPPIRNSPASYKTSPISLIFSTDIRLLTGHAFTGEYAAHFWPQSHDPHHNPCENPSRRPTTSSPAARYVRRPDDNSYSLFPSPCLSHLYNTGPRSSTLWRPQRLSKAQTS